MQKSTLSHENSINFICVCATHHYSLLSSLLGRFALLRYHFAVVTPTPGCRVQHLVNDPLPQNKRCVKSSCWPCWSLNRAGQPVWIVSVPWGLMSWGQCHFWQRSKPLLGMKHSSDCGSRDDCSDIYIYIAHCKNKWQHIYIYIDQAGRGGEMNAILFLICSCRTNTTLVLHILVSILRAPLLFIFITWFYGWRQEKHIW